MDIGLYRDEEQFSTFDAGDFLDTYPDDSTSLDDVHNFSRNELFDCLDSINSSRQEFYDWNTENERELNGDMAVIPVSGSSCDVINTLSTSPPLKEDFQKMLGWQSWQPLLNSGDFPIVDSVIPPEEDEKIVQQKDSNLQEILELPDLPKHSKFDITTYICGEELSEINNTSGESLCLNTSFTEIERSIFDIPNIDKNDLSYERSIEKEPVQNIPVRKPQAGFKKIDLKAQKYIIEQGIIVKTLNAEDDDVDIETISEEESSPVLEAGDLNSLLEQFEATEVPKLQSQTIGNKSPTGNAISNIKIKIEPPDKSDAKTGKEERIHSNNKDIKIKLKQEKIYIDESALDKKYNKNDIKVEINKEIIETKYGDTSNKKESQSSPNEQTLYINYKPQNFKPQTQKHPKTSESTTSSCTPETTSKKQILDSLPRELIDRIKESGKRKPITVIPPIPNNKKRHRLQENDTTNKSMKLGRELVSSETVHLDHNYCSSPGQSSKKDSGFESSEDDDRVVINQQPMVKNVDGKLMVSLLKVNTIRNPDTTQTQKKKLNFEEYKKRRKGLLTPKNNSQNGSPNTSTCSSPLPEDENVKLMKHQEKLRKMAEEVLNTAPKSEKKPDLPTVLLPVAPLTIVAVDTPVIAKPPIVVNPPVFAAPVVTPPVESTSPVVEVKPPPHLERKILVSFGVNTDFKISNKQEDPLAPVEKLEEMKPLLKKVSDKINGSSLITNIIENIPKVINKSDTPSKDIEKQSHHGENKQVLHLEIDRVKTETKSVGTQTNISLIEQSKQGRYRRRRSSSSSSSSSSCNSRSSSYYSRSRKSSDSSSVSSRSSRSSRRSTSSSRSSNYSSRLSSYSRSRSRSPRYSRKRGSTDREHQNAVEERRIIYVGRISSGTTKEDLRRKFQKFGPITNINLHFRDHGENYGFITFKYKEDAHEAYEHGNDDPSYPYYKISFGGRREFCKASYSDLDNMRDDPNYFPPQVVEDSFDTLLREAQEKLRKRKA